MKKKCDIRLKIGKGGEGDDTVGGGSDGKGNALQGELVREGRGETGK